MKYFGLKYFCILLLLITGTAHAQPFMAYGDPVANASYSQFLEDSVRAEVILPKDMDLSGYTRYPLLFLLDRQNTGNYTYNLHTIDYLTQMSAMPPCVLVGVALPPNRRNGWTTPKESGGRAEDFMDYLKEMAAGLGQKYPLADFNLLIGHSRTAIFAMYALSVEADFFDGAIASSASFFDFGDQSQQKAFERFLKDMANKPPPRYLVFSTGESAYGDAHETSVDQLETYLHGRELPAHFKWTCYKEKVDHYATPGLTVNRALTYIFTDYRSIMPACFAILDDSTLAGAVPWERYMAVFDNTGQKLGYPVRPDLLFYNSIASGYGNDYNGYFKQNANRFMAEVLEKAVADYPNDYGFHAWLGEACLEAGNSDKSKMHLEKALVLLAGKTDKDLQAMSAEIERLLQTIK